MKIMKISQVVMIYESSMDIIELCAITTWSVDMRIESYTLNTSDLVDLRSYLRKEFSIEFGRGAKNFFVLAFEDYYFRTNSTQLEMIVAVLVDSKIRIDVIGSAGGSGLLNLDWGSEKKFLKRFSKVIEKYKEMRGI